MRDFGTDPQPPNPALQPTPQAGVAERHVDMA